MMIPKKGGITVDVEKFGAFIQERRKELGMTQSELAERIHVTDKAISRWERAVGFPDIKLLEPLADALELSLTELMQSRKLGETLPESETQALEQETAQLLEEQKKLSWQRRLILYLGYAVIVSMAWVLIRVSHHTALPEKLQKAVYAIATVGAFSGSRALEYIVGRFWLKSKPWGIWHNYYTWIMAAMVLIGFRIALDSLTYDLPSPVWNVSVCLLGIGLMLGGWIYYMFQEEKREE